MKAGALMVVLVLAALAGCGGDSLGNPDLHQAIADELDDYVGDQVAQAGLDGPTLVIEAPFGEESPNNECTGSGTERTCQIVLAMGSTEGTSAEGFAEGKEDDAVVLWEYEYEVEVDDEDCWTANPTDLDIEYDPTLGLQDQINERGPEIDGCL